jgi:hypothetical protein
MFPLVEEPDFMASLGTGAPRTKGGESMSVAGPLKLWKDGAFPRLWRMFWERMRGRHIKHVFRTHPRYHRLDTEFDGELLRLDNTESIYELQLKAQEDYSISKVIDNIARCAIASLFYFELDSMPERCKHRHRLYLLLGMSKRSYTYTPPRSAIKCHFLLKQLSYSGRNRRSFLY